MKRILCILGPRKVLAPAVLVVMTVGPEVAPDLLDLPLSLAIHLQVVSGGQANRHSQQSEELAPYPGDEIRPSI